MVSESLILQWADQRGLLGENPNTLKQASKMLEECNETLDAVIDCVQAGYDCDPSKIYDGIGDVWVTLVILAAQYHTSLDACAWQAWQEIKNRQGVTKNGRFIKETDQ